MTDSDNYPSNWRLVKIGDVCRVRRGASPRPIDSPEWFSNEGRGWVRIVDVTRSDGRLRSTEQRLSKKGEALSVAVDPGQLIMSIAATVGVPAIVEIPVCIHDGFVVFDQYDTNVDTVFLFHFIDYYIPKFRSQGQTGTQSNINTSIVNTMPLPLPPLEEQRAIADILDTIDAAIQNAERVIAKQKAIRSGLLHDLLTYGLDANGEPRDPLNHPEQFQESPLGLIPKVWCESDVDTEFDISSGFTLGSHRRPKNHPRPYLRVANVQRERVSLDDVLELEASDAEMRDKKLEVDDLLIIEGHANPDEIGRCAIVTQESAGMTYQNHIFRLRAKQILPRFALAWLNGSMSRDYWHRMSRTSSGLYTINRTMLRMMPILVPPYDEQIEIAKIIFVQNAVIDAAIAHHDKLIAKKKGLVDDLLTGRVRVSGTLMDEVMEQK